MSCGVSGSPRTCLWGVQGISTTHLTMMTQDRANHPLAVSTDYVSVCVCTHAQALPNSVILVSISSMWLQATWLKFSLWIVLRHTYPIGCHLHNDSWLQLTSNALCLSTLSQAAFCAFFDFTSHFYHSLSFSCLPSNNTHHQLTRCHLHNDGWLQWISNTLLSFSFIYTLCYVHLSINVNFPLVLLSHSFWLSYKMKRLVHFFIVLLQTNGSHAEDHTCLNFTTVV